MAGRSVDYLIRLIPDTTEFNKIKEKIKKIDMGEFIQFTPTEAKKIKKVLIIHGKGIHTTGTDPVLGKLVRSFIERDKRCGASGHPKNKAEGGTGATWIILK